MAIWLLAAGIMSPNAGGGEPEIRVSLLNAPTRTSLADPAPPEPEMQTADTAPQIAAPVIAIESAPAADVAGNLVVADILPPRADPAHLNPDPALPAGHAPATVLLTVLVAADGSVSDARVAQSSGQAFLDQLALAFAKAKWRFRAAMQRGRPVEDWTTVLMRFGPRE